MAHDISTTEMLTALVRWKHEHNTSTQQAICDQLFLSTMYKQKDLCQAKNI